MTLVSWGFIHHICSLTKQANFIDTKFGLYSAHFVVSFLPFATATENIPD